MAEEKAKPKTEDKKEMKEEKPTDKKSEVKDNKETKAKEQSTSQVQDNKEKKSEDKKEEKKPEKKKAPKKEEAIATSLNMPISTKQSVYICSFIKNKLIDIAIADLEEVIKLKKAVPFKGEIPHRKGKGIMSGRYPVKASKLFINLLKALKGNVAVNGLDTGKVRIVIASANQAARPLRRGGMSFKRTHVTLKAKEVSAK